MNHKPSRKMAEPHPRFSGFRVLGTIGGLGVIGVTGDGPEGVRVHHGALQHLPYYSRAWSRMIEKSTSLEYEPSSDPLHVYEGL